MSARLAGTPPFPPLAATNNPARPTTTTSCDLRLSTITRLLTDGHARLTTTTSRVLRLTTPLAPPRGAAARHWRHRGGRSTLRLLVLQHPFTSGALQGAEFTSAATRAVPRPLGVLVVATWGARVWVPPIARLHRAMGCTSSVSSSSLGTGLADIAARDWDRHCAPNNTLTDIVTTQPASGTSQRRCNIPSAVIDTEATPLETAPPLASAPLALSGLSCTVL